MKRSAVFLGGFVLIFLVPHLEKVSAQVCFTGPHCTSPNCVRCEYGQDSNGDATSICRPTWASPTPAACGCGWPEDWLCEDVGTCYWSTFNCSAEECDEGDNCGGDLRPSRSATRCWPREPQKAGSSPRRAMKLIPAPGHNVLTVS
jgi:hypothetical protein